MNKNALTLWRWRAVLVVLSLAILAFDLWAASYWERFTPAGSGTMAATFSVPNGEHFHTIQSMEPESPLARAGAKVGDGVRFDREGATVGFYHLGSDEAVGLTLASGSKRIHLSVVPAANKEIGAHALAAEIANTLWIAVGFFALLTALLIGWRRGESISMRLFALLLLSISLDTMGTITPLGAVTDFCIHFVAPLAYFNEYVLFTLFALTYPEDRPLWRHTWVRTVFYVYLAAFVLIRVYIGAIQFGIPDAWMSPAADEASRVATATWAFGWIAASLSALAFSWRQATGVLRQRLGWLGLCMGFVYASFLLNNLNRALDWPVSQFEFDVFQGLVMFMAMAGFAYALLRHRLFDFGFAVNRALVVTIISSMLLVVFSISEWAVDKLLHFEGREKNVVFDALVALGVILSFHRIQHWVNHRVDHTFFHHWYRAAEKLRHFLDKAAHVSQASALQEKFMLAVVDFCGARGAAFYSLAGSGGYELQASTLEAAPGAIDANHDVVIDLKHGGQAVDLEATRRSLPGELAFPMTVRGHLNGIVLLGARAGGDPFRPDQIALLSTAVHQYGLDLESLRVEAMERRISESEQRTEALKREVEALRRNNQDLRVANEGLLAMGHGTALNRVD
jgi:hypothetical protein